MKEQVQLPFDTRGDAEKDQDKPKALSRPDIGKGFEKPRVKIQDAVRFQNCNACSDPYCDEPSYGNYYWEYRDGNGNMIEGGGPPHGPRLLGGYHYKQR